MSYLVQQHAGEYVPIRIVGARVAPLGFVCAYQNASLMFCARRLNGLRNKNNVRTCLKSNMPQPSVVPANRREPRFHRHATNGCSLDLTHQQSRRPARQGTCVRFGPYRSTWPTRSMRRRGKKTTTTTRNMAICDKEGANDADFV